MGGTSSVPQGGPATQKPPPSKSIVRVKAEKLEKMRQLRLAQEVGGNVHCVTAPCCCAP